MLLTYEVTKDLPVEEVEIATPLERVTVPRISGKKVAVVPILRAGIGMLDGVLSLVTAARVGFIGLYRNEETLQPVEYYVKLPADVAERDVILLDPMLATGNSTAAAVDILKRAGAQSVRMIAIIAAPEGLGAPARRAPGRARRRRVDRPRARRARLHRPGPGRRRRPPVRHEVTDETPAAARLAFEQASAWLAELDERAVLPEGAGGSGRGFGGPLPEDGSGAVAALEELVGGLDAATASPGPRFFHFVTGGVTPAAFGADWLTTALDQNAFSWVGSPLGTRLETVSVGLAEGALRAARRVGRSAHDRRHDGQLHGPGGGAAVVGRAARARHRRRGDGRPAGGARALERPHPHERDEGARDARHRPGGGADVLPRRGGEDRPAGARARRSATSAARRRSSSGTPAT